jgi:hypothetical protein
VGLQAGPIQVAAEIGFHSRRRGEWAYESFFKVVQKRPQWHGSDSPFERLDMFPLPDQCMPAAVVSFLLVDWLISCFMNVVTDSR